MPAPHWQILQNNVSRIVLFCQCSSLVWSIVLPVFYYFIFICLVWCFILTVWKACIVTVVVWFCQCYCTNIVLPLLIFVVVLCCHCCSFVSSVQQSCFDIVKVLSCQCSSLILLVQQSCSYCLVSAGVRLSSVWHGHPGYEFTLKENSWHQSSSRDT